MQTLVCLKLKIKILAICLRPKNPQPNNSTCLVETTKLAEGDLVTVERSNSSSYAQISLKRSKDILYFKIESLSEPLLGEKHIFYHQTVITTINPNEKLSSQVEKFFRQVLKITVSVDGLPEFFNKGKYQGTIKIKL